MFLRVLLLLFSSLPLAAGTLIKGANGQSVDFCAIFDAAPGGLVALTTPDAAAITVPWSKIDMADLKETQPKIHAAYERAVATQTAQPVGLGIAESMLSLSQLPAALTQALKNPHYWPYTSYSYIIYEYDGRGGWVLRVRPHPAPQPTAAAPYILLKQLRDASDDKTKKDLHHQLKRDFAYWGFGIMGERIDYVLARMPPEKIFPRSPKERRLIQESAAFKKTIQTMAVSPLITHEHQQTIKSYFSLLEID